MRLERVRDFWLRMIDRLRDREDVFSDRELPVWPHEYEVIFGKKVFEHLELKTRGTNRVNREIGNERTCY